ncbi:TY4B-J, partial [Symbiodinium necroappetens]
GEVTNEELWDLVDVGPEFEHHEAIGQVAAPVQEKDPAGEIVVELGGGLVKVQRWVVAAKNERVDGKETPIVRCRIVARDYSTGPSASQLGISSPTASAKALKLFLAAIGAEGLNILGLDVSTALLFAWLGNEKVVVSVPEGCVGPGGEKLYLRLKKALYGLRSAALHWTRHLSGLLGKLFGLRPCPTEPCLFTGYFRNKRVFVLSYVDDLLLAGASTEELYEMVEMLRKELKLKVTADLAKDGKILYLGGEILKSEPGGDLKMFLRSTMSTS